MFEPLIKEEAPAEPEAPAAPNPMDAVQQQLAEMRAQINAAYQMNKGIQQPQVQYVPVPVPQAQPDPTPTEAEILADIPGAITTMAQRIAAEREAALRQELGQHLGSLYAKDFERDKKDLAAHPYYKFVADDLEAHFAANPDDRFTPGRLKEKFDQFVGSRIDSIRAAEEQVERVRAVDVAVPVSTSPVPPRTPKKEIKLDSTRDGIREYYNQMFGLNMSAAEWVAIESGKELAPTHDRLTELPPLPEIE